jgi:hypothetical protein
MNKVIDLVRCQSLVGGNDEGPIRARSVRKPGKQEVAFRACWSRALLRRPATADRPGLVRTGVS